MTYQWSWLANLLYFCFFPLFFFYHLFIALGLMPPILGGGIAVFGIAGFVFAVLSVFTWLPQTLKGDKLTALLWYAFLMLCLGYSVYFLVAGGEAYRNTAATQSLQAFVLILAMFFVGYFTDFSKPFFSIFLIFALLSMFVFLIIYSLFSGNIMFYAREFFHADDGVATYQGFARSALLTLLPLIAMSRSTGYQVLIIIVGTYVLFVLGARSEFFSYLLWLCCFCLLFMARSRGFLIAGLAGTVVVLLGLGSVWDTLTASRQLEVTNLSESTSWVARQELFLSTLSIVDSAPVFGDFGAHIREGGHAGAYSHNALSAWVNYGGVGFVLYLLSIVSAFLISTLAVLRSDRSPEQADRRVAFSMMFIVLLLVIVSKPVFWPLTGLAMGLYFKSIKPVGIASG
ncbi:hypothetical protein Q667_19190 [Marinobacter sp. C1S70]|uniref:hypothetical protein n=1 Tax=Marinobacter sp. C1S70 TaxID=1396859 RepID=UPI0003B8D460|nr:hypothetical protein [Marinobacter sp. C1S70]ERS82406.1 hypothetical protein Q667_19190 [Marinobacter sp. C1S70]